MCTMTPEQQRVAIAEWCGWTEIRQIGGSGEVGWPYPKAWIGLNAVGSHQELLPDYLHDLNAIHEAESRLKVDQIGDYENRLYGVTDYRDTVVGEAAIFWSQHSLYRNIHATAAQRSEALLRTLNLWKDS